MISKSGKLGQVAFWATPLVLASLLVVARTESYLLFHTLAELFAIFVAVIMSIVAWQMYSFTRNNYLMFLGCGYFWVAFLDLMHAMTSSGMNLFTSVTDINNTVQFWIYGRYFESILLLVSPVFLSKNLERRTVFFLLGVVAITGYWLVMSGRMPVMLVAGKGLTAFKVYSEYVIIAILSASILFLLRNRKYLDGRILNLMVVSITLTMFSELAFTFYVKVHDISNVLGHIFKLFSYWLIYTAVIRTTLREPFAAMARDVSTYDAIPEAILAIDSNGNVYQANKSAQKLSDSSGFELIGKHCHNLFHPRTNSSIECAICHYINSQQEINGLTMYLPELDKWYEYSLSHIVTGVKVTGMVQTIRDVTDRYYAEKIVRDTEERMQLILNSTYEAIYGVDLKGNCVFVNIACLKLLGYANEKELLGKNMHTLIHHHTRKGSVYPENSSPIYIAFKHGEGVHIDDEVLWRKDGSSFDAEYWSYPMHVNDQCIGLVVTFMDITERRKADLELNHSKNNLAKAQEIANIGSWSWDIASGDVVLSDEAYRIFGLKEDTQDITYVTFLKIVHEDDREYVIEQVNESLADPAHEFSIEHRIKRPSNEIRWIKGKAEISYSDEGRPVNLLGVIYDITEQKKAELVLRSYQADLAEQVKERTLELSAANQQLQQLDHLKSMFIASMSHELRTPLNSIIGFTGVMLNGMTGELNSLQENQLRRVQSSAQHLLSLISDIIDISKIEADRIDVVVERLNLADIVNEAINTVTSMADSKGIRLTVNMDRNIPLETDRIRLKQVLINLISNAVKYTEHGEVSVRVNQSNRDISIQVQDTGVGMKPDDLKKIFNAFERIDNKLSVKSGGAGLGLYLTRKLLETVLNGSISVESEIDKGTIFTVTVPARLIDSKEYKLM